MLRRVGLPHRPRQTPRRPRPGVPGRPRPPSLISASCGVVLLLATDKLASHSFWPVWLGWWVGERDGRPHRHPAPAHAAHGAVPAGPAPLRGEPCCWRRHPSASSSPW
ncbi:hypothetical protein ACRAWF_36360 [Streptomyces sp. L7]